MRSRPLLAVFALVGIVSACGGGSGDEQSQAETGGQQAETGGQNETPAPAVPGLKVNASLQAIPSKSEE